VAGARSRRGLPLLHPAFRLGIPSGSGLRGHDDHAALAGDQDLHLCYSGGCGYRPDGILDHRRRIAVAALDRGTATVADRPVRAGRCPYHGRVLIPRDGNRLALDLFGPDAPRPAFRNRPAAAPAMDRRAAAGFESHAQARDARQAMIWPRPASKSEGVL